MVVMKSCWAHFASHKIILPAWPFKRPCDWQAGQQVIGRQFVAARYGQGSSHHYTVHGIVRTGGIGDFLDYNVLASIMPKNVPVYMQFSKLYVYLS